MSGARLGLVIGLHMAIPEQLQYLLFCPPKSIFTSALPSPRHIRKLYGEGASAAAPTSYIFIIITSCFPRHFSKK